MAAMRSKSVRDRPQSTRLAQIGLALALSQILAAVGIGVAVASQAWLQPVYPDRMIRPHVASARGHVAVLAPDAR